jgi:hypothetical protein
MVGPRPPAGVGRGGIRAAEAWDQEFGETHNPDGTPKGALPNAALTGDRKDLWGLCPVLFLAVNKIHHSLLIK